MNKGLEIRKKNDNPDVRKCNGLCGKSLPSNSEYFIFRKSSANGKFYPSSYCKDCERSKAAANRRAKYATPEGKAKILEQNRNFQIRKASNEQPN